MYYLLKDSDSHYVIMNFELRLRSYWGPSLLYVLNNMHTLHGFDESFQDVTDLASLEKHMENEFNDNFTIEPIAIVNDLRTLQKDYPEYFI